MTSLPPPRLKGEPGPFRKGKIDEGLQIQRAVDGARDDEPVARRMGTRAQMPLRRQSAAIFGSGRNTLASAAFNLFMRRLTMTGSDFEKSLESTKAKAHEVAGQTKDALADTGRSAVEGANSIDLSGLRDEIGKLGQAVGALAQDRASTAGKAVADAAAGAKDRAGSIEADLRPRIEQNPWAAVGLAAFAGYLFAKMI
jgi:ElaB/YqjD/DUF883 family membrane-anchored ribosome-binding protein